MAEPLRLPYTAVTDARGETALRPSLRPALSPSGPTAEASGLVDTGADVNVLPYALRVELGMVWDEQSPLTPPLGNLSRYEARVVLSATAGIRLDSCRKRAADPGVDELLYGV